MSIDKKSDYKHIQFIRNLDTTKKGVLDNVDYIGLDYFDFISITTHDDLRSEINLSNSMACEAYQSIPLFKNNIEKSKYEGDPITNSEEFPVIAIMQITIAPEYYKKIDTVSLDICEEQIEKSIFCTIQKLKFQNQLKVKYRIYRSVSTMDFCVILSCNMIDLPLLISNDINQIKEEHIIKYELYTNLGISKTFNKESKLLFNENSDIVLIARISLKKHLLELSGSNKKIKTYLQKNKFDAHSLTGKYYF